MKRASSLAILFLAVIAASSPVAAADIPARMPVKAPPPAAVPVFAWTGCYIGVHGGGAWGRKRAEGPDFVNTELAHDVDGFFLGGQVGCNVQQGRWVFGIEGQAAWADIDGSVGPDPLVIQGVNGFRTEIDIVGSIAGRIGYAFGQTGQTMIFVKGGAAFAREEHFLPIIPAAFSRTSDSYLRWGWMVGGGFEHALSSNWSFKAEYNYNHFGTKTVDLCSPTGTCDPFEIRQRLHIVKVGINYRWGGGAVVARY